LRKTFKEGSICSGTKIFFTMPSESAEWEKGRRRANQKKKDNAAIV
jgi:hypothetical protein